MFDFTDYLKDSAIGLDSDVNASMNHLIKIPFPIELKQYIGIVAQVMVNLTVLLTYRFFTLWSSDNLDDYFTTEFLMGIVFIILGFITYFTLVKKIFYIEFRDHQGLPVYGNFEQELREFIQDETAVELQKKKQEMYDEFSSKQKEENHTIQQLVQDVAELKSKLNEDVKISSIEPKEEHVSMAKENKKLKRKLDQEKRKRIMEKTKQMANDITDELHQKQDKLSVTDSILPKNYDALFIPNTNDTPSGAPLED